MFKTSRLFHFNCRIAYPPSSLIWLWWSCRFFKCGHYLLQRLWIPFPVIEFSPKFNSSNAGKSIRPNWKAPSSDIFVSTKFEIDLRKCSFFKFFHSWFTKCETPSHLIGFPPKCKEIKEGHSWLGRNLIPSGPIWLKLSHKDLSFGHGALTKDLIEWLARLLWAEDKANRYSKRGFWAQASDTGPKILHPNLKFNYQLKR